MSLHEQKLYLHVKIYFMAVVYNNGASIISPVAIYCILLAEIDIRSVDVSIYTSK